MWNSIIRYLYSTNNTNRYSFFFKIEADPGHQPSLAASVCTMHYCKTVFSWGRRLGEGGLGARLYTRLFLSFNRMNKKSPERNKIMSMVSNCWRTLRETWPTERCSSKIDLCQQLVGVGCEEICRLYWSKYRIGP